MTIHLQYNCTTPQYCFLYPKTETSRTEFTLKVYKYEDEVATTDIVKMTTQTYFCDFYLTTQTGVEEDTNLDINKKGWYDWKLGYTVDSTFRVVDVGQLFVGDSDI